MTLDNADAAFIDAGGGVADTQVEFYFEALVAGLVQVLIDAQSGLATHDLRTADEFGWSESDSVGSSYGQSPLRNRITRGQESARAAAFPLGLPP